MDNSTLPTAVLDLSNIVITDDTIITDVIHEENDFVAATNPTIEGNVDIYVAPAQSTETSSTEIITVPLDNTPQISTDVNIKTKTKCCFCWWA